MNIDDILYESTVPISKKAYTKSYIIVPKDPEDTIRSSILTYDECIDILNRFPEWIRKNFEIVELGSFDD